MNEPEEAPQKSSVLIAIEEERKRERMALAAAAARDEEDNVVLRRMDEPLQKETFVELVERVVTEWVDMHLDCCWHPVFEELDSDNKGHLTAEDFRLMARARLDVLNDGLCVLDVLNFTFGEPGKAVAEEEERRVVDLYMTLDTDGDGIVTFQEFATRFVEWTVEGIYGSIDGEMEATHAQDRGKVEQQFSDILESMHPKLQEQRSPFSSQKPKAKGQRNRARTRRGPLKD